MKMVLGEEHIEPVGAPDLPEFRLLYYFTSATHKSVKDGILKVFTQPSSSLHVVIATIAFGMGINTPDIRYVVHHKILNSMSRLLEGQAEMETCHL